MLAFNATGQSKKKKTANKKNEPTTLEEFMKTEKGVMDYYLNPAGVLYIQVRDNGSANRNGLAIYYCSEGRRFDTRISKVRIMLYGSQNSPQIETMLMELF